MKIHYRKNSLIPFAAAFALLVDSATAATYTWTGTTSGTWNVATNWTGGVPAVANTTDVIISGTTNVGGMLAGSQSYTVKSLIFDGTNDANTALMLQTTGNNNSGSRALTFSSDLGNATMTVAADSTGDKTLNRGGTAVADIVLTSSLDIVHNGSGNLTIGPLARFTSGGGINKSGTGTLLLAGSNTYTGATTISAGTLSLGSGGITGSLTATTSITNNSNLTINRSDAFSQATDLGAGVAITGTGSFTKAGAGITTLTAANTYTGTTTLSAGILNVGVAESVGVSGPLGNSAAINLGSIVFGGGTLQYSASNTHDYSGRFSTDASQAYKVDTNGQNVTWAANLTSSGGVLSKSGAGSLTLTGNNTFTGTINMAANTGTLIAGHNNALGTASVSLNSNTTLTIQNGVTINNPLTAADQGNFKGLTLLSGATSATYSGNISILETSAGNFDINAATGGTLTISGIISGNGFEKVGAGTTTLTAANTYTGATTITSGALAVNGSLANTSTTVGTGATLQGSGSIGGSVTVQGGGTLATGNSIESLTTGALSLQALSTFAYEINNDAAAIVAGDLTAVTGNLTLDLSNTAILTLTDLGSGSWSAGEKLTLISYSGLWNNGLFKYASSTLANGSTFTFSGMEWAFNYNDTVAGTNYTGDLTGSNFVTMTAVPEPNVAALLGGLAAFALLRRRR